MEMTQGKSIVLHLKPVVHYPEIPLRRTAYTEQTKPPPQQGQIFTLAWAPQAWRIPAWPRYVLPRVSVVWPALRTCIPSSRAYPSHWVKELTPPRSRYTHSREMRYPWVEIRVLFNSCKTHLGFTF